VIKNKMDLRAPAKPVTMQKHAAKPALNRDNKRDGYEQGSPPQKKKTRFNPEIRRIGVKTV
jgi:hypothetical protein